MKELIDTLIDKVGDNTTAIRENGDRIKKIPNPAPALAEIDQKMKHQATHLEDFSKIQGEMRTILTELNRKLTNPSVEIYVLLGAMEKHAQLFEKPLLKTVHYKHFLGRSLYVLAAMLVITVSFGCLFFREWQRADQHAENDIKWRALNNYQELQLERAVNKIDSGWLADPAQFEKDVLFEEDRRQSLFRTQQQLDENRQEMERLQKAKKNQ